MTFATESVRAGREPCRVCQLVLDYCSRTYGSATETDTIVSFNDNLLPYSGQLDNAAWTKGGCSIVADAVNDPDGVQTADEIVEDNAAGNHAPYQTNKSTDGSSQYTYLARLKANTRTKAKIRLTTEGFPATPEADFDLTLGTNTGSAGVDAAGIVNEGGGWYTCWLKATSDAVTALQQLVVFLADAGGAIAYVGDGTSSLYCGGVQFEKTTSVNEYQATEDLAGGHTNITLTTGGLTIDQRIGDDAVIGDVEGSLTGYDIVDAGVGWVRVDGDASGEGTGTAIIIAPTAAAACRGTEASGSECYNTRKTCDSTIDWEDETKTYSFSEPRPGIPASEALLPAIRGVSISPTRIAVREALGARATCSVNFQDFPHHDRGIDPYVATRSYTPEEQGTFFGKLLARNPYYQGRILRLKVGYIGSTFDLTNDFQTRTYIIEKIAGPDANGRVTITGKDILKLADDDRAQAPAPNTGVLDANINAVVGTATLSPAGVGNDEYSASGTVRIGSECMTFTRAADVLTITRGTDGTTASAHSAGDSVQECLRYTDQDVSAVANDLLVNYAGIDSSYITIADWQASEDDWLSGHATSALITEPTGVKALLNELCNCWMIYLWWDEVNSAIKFEIQHPYMDTPDALTESANLVADSVRVTQEPDRRRSQIWVYWDIIDPTEPLDKPANYRVLKILVDTDAESAEEYDETRVETVFSRWFTSSGDALRLTSRLLNRLRDNPKKVTFRLDMKDSGYWTGDTVAIETSSVQDVDGSVLNLPVRVIEAREVDGHIFELTGIDEGYDGRYFRIAPNGTPNYDLATDEQKRKYGFICEDAEPQLGGDGPYKLI